LSGGFAFDIAAHSLVYVAAYKAKTQFKDAFEEGVELGPSLNRTATDYSGGIKTDLTPLTSLTLFGSYREEAFKASPNRDATSKMAGDRFGPG
jgi:hypothetical protein